MLETMIIENNLDNIMLYEDAGVSRIFIDLEVHGKAQRQKNRNTHITNHSINDIKKVSSFITKAKLLVRVNPIHQGSEEEIKKAIKYGADILMLPMFRSKREVEKFVSLVNRKSKISLLFETKDSIKNLDSILSVEGIDEIHIGLNDLHIEMNLKFMFEILLLDDFHNAIQKIKTHNIPFGIGGVAPFGDGTLDAEKIIIEHSRLGSSRVILSRGFKNLILDDPMNIKKKLDEIYTKYIEANKYTPLQHKNANELLRKEIITISKGL